jgi:cholesterol oxidase
MAIANIASGVAHHGHRLSSPIEALKPHYDVVVVGSGYGGAVTAARLAQQGMSVCVLERGRELRPGDYPDTLAKASREFHIDRPSGSLFSPTALYDLRVYPDLNVFVGCGLGGTSLINANVVLEPEPYVFDGAPWPNEIQKEARPGGALRHWFREARHGLHPAVPPGPEMPRKFTKLQTALGAIDPNAALAVAHVTVNFGGQQPGRELHPCTSCGDCVSGCNYGAKQTLLATYLPMARANGAAIFTQTRVRSVEKREVEGRPVRWIIHFEHVNAGRERFTTTPLFITARRVILAAGALGTPEILWRSEQTHKLTVSDKLGTRFSSNGDVLAFAYDNTERVNGIGFGRRSPIGDEAPGACITGFARGRIGGSTRYLVEDGVIPGALSPLLSLGFALAGLQAGDGPTTNTGTKRSLWRMATQPLRRRVDATLTLLAMVEDDTSGKLKWDGDRVSVVWPQASRSRPYDEVEGLLRRIATELGGTYIGSPFGNVTVHPLGGCVMANDARDGVVNHIGQVFDADACDPRTVHDGLYVSDASIIPRTLVANPLLTITALAERAAYWITRPAPP